MKDCPNCDNGIWPNDEVYATHIPRHAECSIHKQCFVLCAREHIKNGEIESRFVSERYGGTFEEWRASK